MAQQAKAPVDAALVRGKSMIPKVIHYCWFSEESIPDNIQKCIDSWQTVMSGYEIRCWDSHSFDFDSVPFVREAYSRRKWAFMADYVRLYAIFNEGGIYLDSDVRVLKSFDTFLESKFFIGTEIGDAVHNTDICIDGAIFGAEKGHSFLERCLRLYEDMHFINEDGTLNNIPQPRVITPIAEREFGYIPKDRLQHLETDIIVYPTSFFTHICDPAVKNGIPDSLYALHLLNHSWIDVSPGFSFCKRHHIAWAYPLLKPLFKFLRRK